MFPYLVLASIFFQLLLLAPVLFTVVVRSRSVKGTDRHFFAKSCEMALIILYMLTQLFSYLGMQMLLGGADMRPKMSNGVWPMIRLLVLGKWLQYLLRVDNDDWFNEKRKKLQAWFKNQRRTQHSTLPST